MSATRAVFSFALAATLVSGMRILPAQAGDSVAEIFSDGHSVSPDVLAGERGGAAQSIDASAMANVSGNAVGSYVVTGNNGVANSFNNATGLFTVFQNSGNNVAMQSQTILSVNLQ